jgi:TRAP-type uncharacterized transport system substrate-binding protein
VKPQSRSREPPHITRSIRLNFMGDWGQANFHRICSWLCQEICDRAGPKTRIAILNTFSGGIDMPNAVIDGEVDLCLATPAGLLRSAMTGRGIFGARALVDLRALAVLPQRDRMVFALDPKWGIHTFADLRRERPPITIATAPDDGMSFIGYVAARYMEAHGIGADTLKSWGGSYVVDPRPEQALNRMEQGQVDGVLQEAIMSTWWQSMMHKRGAIALPAELSALETLHQTCGLEAVTIPAGFLPGCVEPLPALDFADFVVLVRSDMAEDIAHLITWCLVETREAIERQYRHIPADRSPLTYPLDPVQMSRVPIPMHPGASEYFMQAGISQRERLV